ncbi:hypothetical protein [uncultured Sphaerochaeta sp.]|uniref:hypothetical protein n=1 Tax=uncultured Sphaerochaeta sp. TaxID=886478 RepID=UPI002A0A471D|nr:hypothetical protein [uncultured Sphaerochaeta sp.]
MNKKKLILALVLIAVVVASVSAASYGNRFSSSYTSRPSVSANGTTLGYGRSSMMNGNRGNYATAAGICLVDGDEVAVGSRLGYAQRGTGMNGYGLSAEDLPEICPVTGEAPVLGSRLGVNQGYRQNLNR